MLKKLITIAAAVCVLNWTGAVPSGHAPEAPEKVPPLVADSGLLTSPAAPESVPGEVLVEFKPEVTHEQVVALGRKLHCDFVENGPESDYHLLRAHSALRAEPDVLQDLAADPEVEAAEPNYVYRAFMVPNDPLYKYQWHMDQVHAPQAWDQGAGKGAVVAVIDTGVAFEDYKQFRQAKDLKGTKFVPGWDFIHRNAHPNDDHAHGTHVAGTIAQTTNNKEGVTGLAYEAAIMPIKVLSAQGMGNVGDIAEAIKWAADHKANVINMSLGGSGYSRVLKDACDYAKKKGVTIVCAAGNNGQQKVSYPAAYPACLAVSATRFDETVTWYSNYGKEICVAAPGGDTRVDQNGDGYPDGVLQNTISRTNPAESTYELFQGTSMASPHAAAVAALIVSQGIRDPDEVRQIMMKTARPKGTGRGDIKYGAGIVDAAAAQKLAAEIVGNRRLAELAGVGAAALWGTPLAGVSVAWAAVPALMAACGLYFVPARWVPEALAHPLLSAGGWATAIDGSVNPILYSALLPLLASVLLFGWRRGRSAAVGVALGTAAMLADTACFGGGEVTWVPNHVLAVAWLAANALVLITLARRTLHGSVKA